MKLFAIAALAAVIATPALAEDHATHTTTTTTAATTTTTTTPAVDATTQAYWDGMDTNKDGKISMEEHKAVTDTWFADDAAFAAADTDKDGALSVTEVVAAKAAKDAAAAH